MRSRVALTHLDRYPLRTVQDGITGWKPDGGNRTHEKDAFLAPRVPLGSSGEPFAETQGSVGWR